MANLKAMLACKWLQMKGALKNERGETNIIAIILILAVVIGLVIIFRDSITSLLRNIMGGVSDQATDIVN